MSEPTRDAFDAALGDPTRLGVLAETGLVADSAVGRISTFDRVARLAARALRAPVAQVNLVTDNEQVAAGAFVDDALPGAGGLPLDPRDADVGGRWRGRARFDASYCHHVVRRGGALVVDDAPSHPLVRGCRVTHEAGIGAYAGVPLVAPAGVVLGTVCVVDFTERQWSPADVAVLEECAALASEELAARLGAARALRERDERLRLAVEGARLGTWSLDVASATLTVSDQFKVHHGRAADAPFATADWTASIGVGDRARARATLDLVLAGAGDRELEYRVVAPAGAHRWVHAYVHAVDGPAGAPARVVGLTQDVTERVHAERALRASEARYRTLVESAHEGIVAVDLAGRTTYANRRMAEMLGHPVDALSGRPVFDFVTPDAAFDARTRFARWQRGIAETIELSFGRADGSTLWCTVSAGPIHDPDGSVVGVLAFATDVTERRRAEAALRASEERYALAARAASNVIWDWDVCGGSIAWSDGVSDVLGYGGGDAPDTFARWLDAVHPEDAARVDASLRAALGAPDGTREWRDEYRFRRADGTYATVVDRGYVLREPTGRPVRMIGALEDVTAQRQLEAQLRQAQKMEALGRLAGGVAHDFNNLLAVITGNVTFALEDLADGRAAAGAVRADLAEVEQAAERARVLVRQLLTFSRKQAVEPRPVRVGEVVTAAERLLRRVIGEEIRLEVSARDDLATVRADPGHLDQILMNLAINARDAMLTPRHGHPGTGGTLAITVDTLPAEPDPDRPGEPAAACMVRLQVRDTGHGMDPETQAHVFEPFFTTKEVGSGTGLGLATVFGIVQQTGGRMQVESAPGRGATFTIFFPAASDPDRGARTPPPPASAPVRTTVLLVEDDAAVASTVRRTLERQGHRVFEARGGVDALELWRTHADEIAVVVTDLRMPALGGRELVALLRRDRPGLPVVYASGYADARSHDVGLPGEAFLPKPFAADDLRAALCRVLDAEWAPPG